MPKHRATVFSVVREKLNEWEGNFGDREFAFQFDSLVGTFQSLQRADEVAAATIQHLIDAGMNEYNPEYRCTVKPSTYYEE